MFGRFMQTIFGKRDAQFFNEMWLAIDKKEPLRTREYKPAREHQPKPYVNHQGRYRRLRREKMLRSQSA